MSASSRKKYKPGGQGNCKPKALRQFEEKKSRIKNNRELRVLVDLEEYDYDPRVKVVLPYWD